MVLNLIGIDPSLTATGIARIVDDEVVDWTTLRTKPGADKKMDDVVRRVYEVSNGVREFMARDRGPTLVCIEGQVASSFGKASLKNVGMLMAAFGGVIGVCQAQPLVIAPGEIRRRLRGRGEVSKDEIRGYCKAHFGDAHPKEPKTKGEREAVWDAVAVVLAMEPEIDRLEAYVAR